MADAAPLPILPESPCGCGTVAQPLRACERERYCWKEKFASSPQILRKRQKFDIGSNTSVMCSIDMTAFARIGGDLGLIAGGVQTTISIFEKGKSHDYGFDVMKSKLEGNKIQSLATVRRFQCRGRIADRMDQFEIFTDSSPVDSRSFLFASDPPNNKPRIYSIGSQKMFEISGNDAYYDYKPIWDELYNQALRNTWIASLDPRDREVVLEFIIREITVFSSS